ncbi:MAG: hypothetical protein Q8P90_02095 [bacterium]|nr:hypothetical protein [bacterium]
MGLTSGTKKGKGVKKIEGMGVGSFYFYSSKLPQDDGNANSVVDDKDALSIAEQFNERCGSSRDNSGSVLVDLSKTGRLQSTYDNRRYSVSRDGVVFWIKP